MRRDKQCASTTDTPRCFQVLILAIAHELHTRKGGLHLETQPQYHLLSPSWNCSFRLRAPPNGMDRPEDWIPWSYQPLTSRKRSLLIRLRN